MIGFKNSDTIRVLRQYKLRHQFKKLGNIVNYDRRMSKYGGLN